MPDSPPPSTGAPCRLLVCTHTRYGLYADSCGARGADGVLSALRGEAATGRLPAMVEEGVCFGYCRVGPNVRIVGGPLLHRLSADDLEPVRAAVLAVIETGGPWDTAPSNA